MSNPPKPEKPFYFTSCGGLSSSRVNSSTVTCASFTPICIIQNGGVRVIYSSKWPATSVATSVENLGGPVACWDACGPLAQGDAAAQCEEC